MNLRTNEFDIERTQLAGLIYGGSFIENGIGQDVSLFETFLRSHT